MHPGESLGHMYPRESLGHVHPGESLGHMYDRPLPLLYAEQAYPVHICCHIGIGFTLWDNACHG